MNSKNSYNSGGILYSKVLSAISRYVMAALFIFSGATKAVNTFGLSIQLGEYFSAMGLDFLKPLAEVGSIILPSLEIFLGICLLFGLIRWYAAWGALLFMVFFTFLTLWIAIANPVSDCGCFGDVIKMSNWATFIKNIILLPLAVIVWINRGSPKNSKRNTLWSFAAFVIVTASVMHLNDNIPVIDSTPYKIGVNIPEAMQASNGSKDHTTLIYKNIATGKIQEFELDDTTWYDGSKWEYVDTRTTSSGSHLPAITGIPMINSAGDQFQQILAEKGYVLIIVRTKLKAIKESRLSKLEALAAHVRNKGGRVILLTSTALPSGLAVETELEKMGVEMMESDYSTLNTMIQNKSGGIILLYGGTIKGKWALNHLPSLEKLF